MLDGGVDELLQVGDLADVGFDADGLIAEGHDLGFECFGRVGVRDVVDDDVGALGGERERDRFADAAVAAGDDGDLSFEAHALLLGVGGLRSQARVAGHAGRGWSAAGAARRRAMTNAPNPIAKATRPVSA